MADQSLSALYTRNRETADREELEQFLAQPPQLAPAPATAPTPALAKPTDKGFVAGFTDTAKAGASAFWDTFQAGAANIFAGVQRVPEAPLAGAGKTAFGALQILASLPAGIGATVQQVISSFVPGKEQEVALPGATTTGGAAAQSAAGWVRSILSVPQIIRKSVV